MDSWLAWVSATSLIIVAIVGGVFAWINRRGGELSKREGTWGELVQENRDLRKELNDFRDTTERRFDAVDKKFGALERVLAAVADQWPHNHPGPDLDQADIDELGTTLPVRFRPKRRTRGTKE